MEQFSKALIDGFVHSGEYVKFRKKTFGTSSASVPGNHFVAFAQNHDQIGNRPEGDRLSVLVDFERLKIAAAAVLLSPYIPMLFMGEEYGEENPFLYFMSHSDRELIKAVQEGRKKEFADYKFKGSLPDPQNEDTFRRSKLDWEKREQGKHQKLLNWHQALIQLRRTHAVLQNFNKADVKAQTLEQDGLVLMRQSHDQSQNLICLFNFSEEELSHTLPNTRTHWSKVLNSKERQWLQEQDEKGYEAADQLAAGQKLALPPLSVLVYQSQR